MNPQHYFSVVSRFIYPCFELRATKLNHEQPNSFLLFSSTDKWKTEVSCGDRSKTSRTGNILREIRFSATGMAADEFFYPGLQKTEIPPSYFVGFPDMLATFGKTTFCHSIILFVHKTSSSPR